MRHTALLLLAASATSSTPPPTPAELGASLISALGIDASTLHAFLHELEAGRAARSAEPLPKAPAMINRLSKRKRAQFVFMRLSNLLWDGGALPLPFVPNGPELIPRKRIEDGLRQTTTLVQRALMDAGLGPSSARPNMGCLEWDETTYTGSVFNFTCTPGALNRFDYSPNETKVIFNSDLHSGASSSSVPTYQMDMCAKALDQKIVRRVAKSGGFKLVVPTEVWEHLASPFGCARNLYEMMAPGGIVVFTVPFQFPFHGMPSDYFRYTPEGMAAVASAAGFNVLKSFRVGSRRESTAMDQGFPVSAVPPEVFDLKSDAFFHTAVVVAQRGGF